VSEPVVRSVELAASPPEVWDALTEASLLSGWFDAEAEVDARVGGSVRFRFADAELRGVVVACEPPRRLSFRWRDVRLHGDASVVEFSLEELDGGTRLVVTESPGVVAAQLVAR